jgi:hypothetical protein
MYKIKTVINVSLPIIFVFASIFSQFSHVAADCEIAIHTDCGTDMPYFVVMGGDIVEGAGFESPILTPNASGQTNTCSGSYGNTINSWNTNDTEGNGHEGYYGAATQDATYNDDTDFQVVTGLDSDLTIGSAQGNAGYTYNGDGTTNYPDGASQFAFANKDLTGYAAYDYMPQEHFYGGGFGEEPCMQDYYSNALMKGPHPSQSLPASAMTGPNTVDLSLLSQGGSYSYTEQNGLPLIIDDTNSISTATPITLAVDGNVYIDSNIKYSYTSLDAIPELNVYAYGTTHPVTPGDTVSAADSGTYGNIYVDSSVSEIHGFYVAQSNDQYNPYCAAGPTYTWTPGCDNYYEMPFSQPPYNTEGFTDGLFSTCASISPDDKTIKNLTTYQTCDQNQLTVYGSVSAVVFWLERDNTSYNDVAGKTGTTNASNAAEVFRYTPETWIPYVSNNNDCTTDISSCLTSSSTYDSEVSLPPVL